MSWEFEGNTYRVGDSFNEEIHKDNVYPIVWYKGKVYKGTIRPEAKGKLNRICLVDIYDNTKKVYWTTVDKVFQVIKET